jgi:hypothetical protein
MVRMGGVLKCLEVLEKKAEREDVERSIERSNLEAGGLA